MRFILLTSLLCLTACGFTPVYGTQANKVASQNLEQIEIALIPNREGQFLRNALIDRFYKNGAPANPKYRLRFSSINEATYNFDITVDSEATRRQLKLTTAMHLIDLETKRLCLAVLYCRLLLIMFCKASSQLLLPNKARAKMH